MSDSEPGPSAVCVVANCGRPVHAKDRCQAHYRKFLKYGTDNPTPDMKKKPGPKPDPTKWRSRHNQENPSRSRPKKPRPDRTHCKRGHALDDANVYLSKSGSKSCRACLRENTARWRKLNPQPAGPGIGSHQRSRTHCPQGHPYDEINTYHYRGGRYCKTCARNNQKKHYEEIGRYKKYGITKDHYLEFLEKQDGNCAICVKPLSGGKDEHIDHDHVTGQVRGVLCSSCNLAIGKLKDSPEIILRAAEYIMRSWDKSSA